MKWTLLLLVSIVCAQSPETDRRAHARKMLDMTADMVASVRTEVQVSALLHLADNYHVFDTERAEEMIAQAFTAAESLEKRKRDALQGEIVRTAASIRVERAVEMWRQMQAPPPRALERIVESLIEGKKFDQAIALLGESNPYSYGAANRILSKLADQDPRREVVFASAVAAFQSKPDLQTMGASMLTVLAEHWRKLPPPMVEEAAKAAVNWLLEQKPTDNLTASLSGSKGSVTFTDRANLRLFELMPVIAETAPKLAKATLESRPELRAAYEKFPEGRKSLGEDNFSFRISQTDGPMDPSAQARMRLDGEAQTKTFQALALLKEGPDKALDLVPTIANPAKQAEVLAAAARSVGEKDPGKASGLLGRCMELLGEIKEPETRVSAWDAVAEAAHRVHDHQTAWTAMEKALEDIHSLYKADIDEQAPNEALRENWPSTQHFRRVVSMATRLYGVAAEPMLGKILDHELRLLAQIEMAQALLGRPRTSGSISVSRSRR